MHVAKWIHSKVVKNVLLGQVKKGIGIRFWTMLVWLLIGMGCTTTYAADWTSSNATKIIYINQGEAKWLSNELMLFDQLPAHASIEQVQQAYQAGQFRWNGDGNPNLGYERADLWVAFRFQSLKGDLRPLIEVAYAPLDHIQIYQMTANGAEPIVQAGDQEPYAQRNMPFRNVLAPLEAQGQDVRTILIHVETQGAMKVPVRLMDSLVFGKAIAFDSIFDGIYFGTMLIVAMINLVYFINFRKVLYLYYFAFLVMFSIFVAGYRGYVASEWLNDSFFWNQWSICLGAFTAIGFLSLFAIQFLQMYKSNPRYTWFMRVLVGMSFLLASIMWFFPYVKMIRLVSEVTLVSSVVLLIAGSIRFRAFHPARLFTWAFFMFFILVGFVAATTLKLMPTYPWTEYMLELGSLLQNIILFIALSDEIRTVQREKELSDAENLALQQKNQEQLQEWNVELSMKVKGRTSSIQQLLDHSNEGFFKIEHSLKIGREYSAECRRLFGSPFAERAVVELLEPDDPFQQKFLLNVLQDLFKSADPFQRDVMKTLLPEQFERNGFIVRLRYKWVEQVGSQAAHLLAIATDITNELRLKKQMEEERLQFEMVIQVFSHTEEFVEILQSVESLLSVELLNWTTYAFDSAEVYQECFRTVHTLKGTASQMKLYELSRALHEMEDQVLNRKWSKDPFKLIHNAWEKDLSVIHHWLGEKITKQDSIVTIERKMLIELRNKLSEHPTPWSIDLISMLNRHLNKTVQDLLNMYPSFVERVAQSLDKWVHPLKITGEAVWVDPERIQIFIKTLVHVFRNMIDHGLETVDERLEMGKSEIGTITCTVLANGADLRLMIADDGRGINPDYIRNKAIEKELITQEKAQELNAIESLNLIWLDGFSTRDFVTEISGRGIGLAAVRAEIEQLGGHVQVHSIFGEGTTFTFDLPNVVIQTFQNSNIYK